MLFRTCIFIYSVTDNVQLLARSGGLKIDANYQAADNESADNQPGDNQSVDNRTLSVLHRALNLISLTHHFIEKNISRTSTSVRL